MAGAASPEPRGMLEGPLDSSRNTLKGVGEIWAGGHIQRNDCSLLLSSLYFWVFTQLIK